MKTTKIINYFLMGLCIILSLLNFIVNGFWILAAICVLILGVFQGITGLLFFMYKPFSTRFQLYMGGLLLFLGSYYLPWEKSWMLLPLPLSLYFTFMLHTINSEKL